MLTYSPLMEWIAALIAAFIGAAIAIWSTKTTLKKQSELARQAALDERAAGREALLASTRGQVAMELLNTLAKYLALIGQVSVTAEISQSFTIVRDERVQSAIAEMRLAEWSRAEVLGVRVKERWHEFWRLAEKTSILEPEAFFGTTPPETRMREARERLGVAQRQSGNAANVKVRLEAEEDVRAYGGYLHSTLLAVAEGRQLPPDAGPPRIPRAGQAAWTTTATSLPDRT